MAELTLSSRHNDAKFRVLTRRNSKTWNAFDFNGYEKELKGQMKTMETEYVDRDTTDQQKTSCDAKPISKRRRHSTISPTNCGQWSHDDMRDYETEIMTELKRLIKDEAKHYISVS